MEVLENNSYTSGNNSIPWSQPAVILGSANIIFVIIGIPGNALVILAVLLSKRLQNVSSAFIANLAVADLMTCLVMPLFTVAQFVNYYSPFLEPMCMVAVTVAHTCIGGSIFSLAAIAFSRFMVIAASMRFYKLKDLPIFRPKVVALSIVVLWSLSLSIAILPPFAFDVGKVGFDYVTHSCAPIVGYPGSDIFKDILVYGFYPIPLTIIVVSYIGILVQLLIHNRNLAKSGANSPQTSGRDGIGDGKFLFRQKQLPIYSRRDSNYKKHVFCVCRVHHMSDSSSSVYRPYMSN
ncbi:5-hydroxytryptamine receptor 2B [Holothuria leucospilota]|uniref:5-hydroxytryptamine receptor 2B n=1 Tax=Holothuria leucospilota TaxID=206669 RepID=A0A9Q1CCI9_HOLLE|nr:5-hydroxytryptamine receptor 2B [Holothuria leucospilota]